MEAAAIKMGFGEIKRNFRHNHLLRMVICCLVPLTLLYVAVYFLGLKSSYLYWGIILLCPLMHYLMMRDMHKKEGDKKEKESCH